MRVRYDYPRANKIGRTGRSSPNTERLTVMPYGRHAIGAATRQGRKRMSRKNRHVLWAAIAFAAVGAVYAMSGSSTASSDRNASTTPRIDVLAIMTGVTNLPNEQFDAS